VHENQQQPDEYPELLNQNFLSYFYILYFKLPFGQAATHSRHFEHL